MKFVFLLFLFFFSFSRNANAFPEMVRHGYVNCTTCHISPNGGGVLTAYGRSLSREVLSTWGTEKETRFMYFMESPEWLHLGGDVRWMQWHKDTPTYKEGRFLLMQADLEAGATYKQFTAVATLGRSDVDGPKNAEEFFTSHRHYLIYRPMDEWTVRAGRFYPAFGLNPPDHVIATRRGLRWDQGGESYNVEAAYIGEKFDAFVTGIFGRPDKPAYQKEKGFALRSAVNFSESHKVGLSYYYGENDRGRRHLVGPYGIFGFRPDLFLLMETDLTNTGVGTASSYWGIAHYLRFDYEFYRGMHVFLAEERGKSRFDDHLSDSIAYGGGLQFFPRPHFEVTAQYQKYKVNRIDDANFTDFLWVMLHFYP